MKIKKDDMVVVISGKDKGTTGKVLKAMPKENRVIVEGVNVQTKHQKQTRTEKAEIRHVEGPINVSNVALYDAKSKEIIKIGYEVRDGKKYSVRIADSVLRAAILTESDPSESIVLVFAFITGKLVNADGCF